MVRLLRKNGEALYEQLTKILMQQILKGEILPNKKVPSEKELSKYYQVSRITAKQALQQLEIDGLIYRVQGSGSFVTPKRLKRQLNQLGGFSEDLEFSGINVERKILEYSYKSPPENIRAQLALAPKEMALIIKRLIFLEEEPIAIFTSYHPEHLVRGLEIGDFEKKGLYGLIQKKLNLKLGYAEQIIELGRADAGEARLLTIPIRIPIFRTTRKTYLENGKPIELAKAIFKGDRVQFYAKLESSQQKGG